MTTQLPLAQRLIKGAGVLGRLYKSGERCARAWSMDCDCAEPLKDFCKAKRQWVKLFLESPRKGDVDFGEEFGLIESMTEAELEATGLMLTLEFPELGELKVGPGGQIPWKEFRSFRSYGADALATVATVLKEFPGARVI